MVSKVILFFQLGTNVISTFLPLENHTRLNILLCHLGDWSLITGRGGGAGLQNAPPPSRQGKPFCAPTFKEWKLFAPLPLNMAETSSFYVKTTPKQFVPPFSMAKAFSDAPFRRGKTSRAPPSRFVAPPLPVISDQALDF